MKPFWKRSMFPLRSCMNCGSWLSVRTFFCLKCHQRCLKQFHDSSVVQIEDVSVKSLFRWPPGKSDVLSSLVLQMKDEPMDAWTVWAEEFSFRWDTSGLQKKVLFVSSESSSGGQHAQNWGEALSRQYGLPHLSALKPVHQGKSQKELNKTERSSRAFDLNVDFSNHEDKRIIFVDDVVTTGQTALAAYEALNRPVGFEAWCLIYREP